jgi:signal transduction histidine kinase
VVERAAHPEPDIVQRVLARSYERLGPRILIAVLPVILLIGVVTIFLTLLWAGRYLRLRVQQLVPAFAIGMPGAIAIFFLVVWTLRGTVATVLLWGKRDRTPERAEEVWNAAVDLPYRLVTRTATVIPPLGLLLELPVASVSGISVTESVGTYSAGMVAMLAVLVPVLFGIELTLRPLLEDVAAFLPADFVPAKRAWRLRTKAVAALPSVTLFGALTVGAFADVAVGGTLRLLIAFGIALATIAVAGLIFWLVMRALLEPVDDLFAATRRVSEGDIETSVPVVTGDELGSLAAGFNRMLADLRRHEAELRESRARVVAAADAARRRVERDLHDGAQQQLVLVGLKLGAARKLVDDDPARAGAVLDELRGDLDRALAELRDLAHGLYPQLLESEGLRGALRDAASRSAIPTEVEFDGAGRYPAEVEAAVYFCCLEALQNAGKHAGADAHALVKLHEEPGTLSFEVSDNGRGFEANGRPAGAGLENMADRVAALGGELRVNSRPGAGTTIAGTIPLD